MKLLSIPTSLLDTRLLDIDSSLESFERSSYRAMKWKQEQKAKEQEKKSENKKKYDMPDEGHSYIRPKDNDPL